MQSAPWVQNFPSKFVTLLLMSFPAECWSVYRSRDFRRYIRYDCRLHAWCCGQLSVRLDARAARSGLHRLPRRDRPVDTGDLERSQSQDGSSELCAITLLKLYSGSWSTEFICFVIILLGVQHVRLVCKCDWRNTIFLKNYVMYMPDLQTQRLIRSFRTTFYHGIDLCLPHFMQELD